MALKMYILMLHCIPQFIPALIYFGTFNFQLLSLFVKFSMHVFWPVALIIHFVSQAIGRIAVVSTG